MAKATSSEPMAKKPARSKTRAATTKPRAVRTAAKAPVPAQTEVTKPSETGKDVERQELSKKDLVERLVRDTDMKKGDARRALEAVLGVLHGALAEGSEIAAAPLGKIKIARTKETPTGQLVVCRVKLKKPQSVTASVTPLDD